LTLLATILHLALPPLSILAFGGLAPRRGFVWTVVAGMALYESALLCSGLLLGYLGLLREPGPLVFWILVTASLLFLAVRGAGPAWRAARGAVTDIELRALDLCLGAAAVITVYLIGLQVARDWIKGTENFDSLAYHIPRALQWAWHGNFRPYPTAEWQQVGLSIGGDVALLPGVFLGIGWLGGAWTTVWLSLGAAAAVFAATRDLGAGPRPSLVAALAFLSFPAVGPRLADVNSDMAAAFPLVAAWVLATRARSPAEAAFLFPALCGVGVACKGNIGPAVLVLAVAFFGSRLRAVLFNGRALAASAAGTLFAALVCIGSYLPVYRIFGDLLGGHLGRDLASFKGGPAGVARAALFGTLHWLVEPFALVSEPPRFDLLDGLGIDRLYGALGAGTRESWYPALDSTTNRSGVFPFLALPWLLAALPKGKRLRGGILFLALLLAVFAPLYPNCYASRFAVVLLAAFAVLWGARASQSPWLAAILLIVSLGWEARYLQWRRLSDLSLRVPDRNARIAAAVGSHTLWLLGGSMSPDARIAGQHADVRFEYLSCPQDGNWTRRFAEIRGRSPWLLLGDAPKIDTGPWFPSAFGPPCPGALVAELRLGLAAAGWRLVFEENGYQIWSGEPARQSEDPEKNIAHPGGTPGGI
jgi:hypothetical protein